MRSFSPLRTIATVAVAVLLGSGVAVVGASAASAATSTTSTSGTYVVTAWSEDNYNSGQYVTPANQTKANQSANQSAQKRNPNWFPQTFVASVTTDTVDANTVDLLDSVLTCGTYQVDVTMNNQYSDAAIQAGVIDASHMSWPGDVFSTNWPPSTVGTGHYYDSDVDSKIISVNTGCTPAVRVDPAVCTTYNGTSVDVAVNATKLVKNRTYTVVVKDGTTVIDTVSNVSGATGTFSKTYSVPVGDSITATVTDNAMVTNFPGVTYSATSSTVTAGTCPAVAAETITVDQTACTSVGGTPSTLSTTVGDLTPGETYTVNATSSTGGVAFTNTFRADATTKTVAISPFTGGAHYTVSVSAQGLNITATSADIIAPGACPEVAATTITADTPAAATPTAQVAAATLATTGVNPVGPSIMALAALQLGLGLVAVSIIRRRRSARS